MKRTFAVIGLGTLGSQLVRSLYEGGADVLPSTDEDAVSRLKDNATQAICLHGPTNRRWKNGFFRRWRCRAGVAADFDMTVLGTYMCKRGVKEINAGRSDLEAQAIQAVGATSVVFRRTSRVTSRRNCCFKTQRPCIAGPRRSILPNRCRALRREDAGGPVHRRSTMSWSSRCGRSRFGRQPIGTSRSSCRR